MTPWRLTLDAIRNTADPLQYGGPQMCWGKTLITFRSKPTDDPEKENRFLYFDPDHGGAPCASYRYYLAGTKPPSYATVAQYKKVGDIWIPWEFTGTHGDQYTDQTMKRLSFDKPDPDLFSVDKTPSLIPDAEIAAFIKWATLQDLQDKPAPADAPSATPAVVPAPGQAPANTETKTTK